MSEVKWSQTEVSLNPILFRCWVSSAFSIEGALTGYVKSNEILCYGTNDNTRQQTFEEDLWHPVD